MNAIYNLLEDEYIARMMHPIPRRDVVSRERYILDACQGKVTLDIGASGPMSAAIGKVAKEYYGIDVIDIPGLDHLYQMDIDNTDEMPEIPGVEIVIAGEVLEHLSNAGHFLDLLHAYGCPVILTTPNAFSETGYKHVSRRSVENVNPEHVAYYSYRTLKTLVERHGWMVLDWHWYNGKPGTAEGLIFILGGNNA